MPKFVSSAYAQDTRPVKVEGKEAPSGGWRTKSGLKKLGRRAIIEAKTFGDAIDKTSELLAGLSPTNAKKVARVVIALDTSDPSAGGNPFEE